MPSPRDLIGNSDRAHGHIGLCAHEAAVEVEVLGLGRDEEAVAEGRSPLQHCLELAIQTTYADIVLERVGDLEPERRST